MATDVAHSAKDWVGRVALAPTSWPGGFLTPRFSPGFFSRRPSEQSFGIIALAWMGTACILNARRCGRTHYRFTGPYYLALIVPVLVLGSGVISAGLAAWFALGVVIVFGSKLIWWGTERPWGIS